MHGRSLQHGYGPFTDDAGKGGAPSLLFRRGPYDTKKLLETQAAAAEKSTIGIHGVSASSDATAKAGQVVRCATCSSVDAETDCGGSCKDLE